MLETDARFPSGRWIGYFLQKLIPGRQQMELLLMFGDGVLRGEGRDLVGTFLVAGSYNLHDGSCHWTKRYLGKHDVHYRGYNEGKGIWGVWSIPGDEESIAQQGGFHIWPEGMAGAEDDQLSTATDLPIRETELAVAQG